MRKRFFAFVALVLAVPACDRGPGSDREGELFLEPAQVSITDLVHDIRPLTLQESDTALVVNPVIHSDPLGGWIVADVAENQVRLYDAEGGLRRVVGRGGDGPGEFNRPVASGRFADGRLWAVDMRGRVTVFDRAGTDALRTASAAIAPVYRAWDWPGDSLLFAGRGQQQQAGTTFLLHVVDPESGRITRSFFPVPVADDPATRAIALSAGALDVDIKADTIAAVFPMVDTVYLLDRVSGDRIGARWIPSTHMRRLSGPPDITVGFQEVIESFSMVLQVFWVDDGLLVHFGDYENRRRTNGLVYFRSGSRPREVYPAPGLMLVDGHVLIFEDTTGMAPNALLRGEWARGRGEIRQGLRHVRERVPGAVGRVPREAPGRICGRGERAGSVWLTGNRPGNCRVKTVRTLPERCLDEAAEAAPVSAQSEEPVICIRICHLYLY